MSLNSIIGIPIATIAKTTNKQATEIARMSSPTTGVAINFYNDFGYSTVGQVPLGVDNHYGNPLVVDDNGNKVCRIVGAQNFRVDLNPASSYVRVTAKIKYISGDKFWVFGLRSTPENILTTGSWGGDSRLSIYKTLRIEWQRLQLTVMIIYGIPFKPLLKMVSLHLKKRAITIKI